MMLREISLVATALRNIEVSWLSLLLEIGVSIELSRDRLNRSRLHPNVVRLGLEFQDRSAPRETSYGGVAPLEQRLISDFPLG